MELVDSPPFVVSNWGRNALRKLPRYWPHVTYLTLPRDDRIDLHLSCDAIIVSLHIDPINAKCIQCTVNDSNINRINQDSKFDDDINAISDRIMQIDAICGNFVQNHSNVSLLVFIEGICDEIFKLYSELQVKPPTFLSSSRRSSTSGRGFDWNWSEGCDLLLFLLCSSSVFGGVKSSLKPFPEFDRIEDCSWTGSGNDLKEVSFCVSQLQEFKIQESRDVLQLDRKTQWIPIWVEKYQNVVLRLKRREVPDPQIHAGSWKPPDYQFDAELLPDPYFDSLCKKHSKIIAYHGSPTANWYSIIRNGLEIRSWTSQMRHGAMLGSGIYFSGDCKMAQLYGQAQSGWNQCPLGKELEVIGVYEIAACPNRVRRGTTNGSSSRKPSHSRMNSGTLSPKATIPIPPNYIVVEDNELVRLKSLLVWRKREVKHSKLCTQLLIVSIISLVILIIAVNFLSDPSSFAQLQTNRSWRKFKRFIGL
jgi:hypothetical protein